MGGQATNEDAAILRRRRTDGRTGDERRRGHARGSGGLTGGKAMSAAEANLAGARVYGL